jgi:hypothetical protein
VKVLRDVLLASAFVAVIGWIVWPQVRELVGHRRIAKRYVHLRLGMTATQVSEAMQSEPDCVVAVGSARVAYYAPLPKDVQAWPACRGGAVASRWDDLPVIYAAAEVAFDSKGVAVAHGFCGEGGAAATRGRPSNCMRHLAGDARPQ